MSEVTKSFLCIPVLESQLIKLPDSVSPFS